MYFGCFCFRNATKNMNSIGRVLQIMLYLRLVVKLFIKYTKFLKYWVIYGDILKI